MAVRKRVFELTHPNAAGIDVGRPVTSWRCRRIGTTSRCGSSRAFTEDLYGWPSG